VEVLLGAVLLLTLWSNNHHEAQQNVWQIQQKTVLENCVSHASEEPLGFPNAGRYPSVIGAENALLSSGNGLACQAP
jgi:hypothetical protein